MTRGLPRVGIIGDAGHVGGAALAEGARPLPVDVVSVRPDDLRDLDVVVNAAAKTDLAWCEANAREALYVNAVGAVLLARACRQAGVRLVHLSSGCVWDGPYKADGRPFQADDPPTPTCVYSWTKALADTQIEKEGLANVAILRPRQVFSTDSSPRNTLVKLAGYGRLIGTDNSMTSAQTLAETIRALVLDDQHALWGRVSCVYDRGVMSPYDIGCMMADAGLRPAPTRMEKGDLDSWWHPRRVDVVMRDQVFEACVKPPEVRDRWQEAIRAWQARTDAAGGGR